jgi:hypothetical protein
VVWVHTFFTSAFMEVNTQLHVPPVLPPGKEPLLPRLDGPLAGLSASEKTKISCPCRESVYAVAQLVEALQA